MKLNLNPETLADALDEALLKTVFRGKDSTESQREAWLRANHDKIAEGVTDALEGIMHRLEHPPGSPKAPVLEFKTSERNTIRLWVLDAHQTARLADHHSFWFGGDETAGLIYEETGNGHRATESNIYNPSTWQWIQEWMAKGMASEGLLHDVKNPVQDLKKAAEFAATVLNCAVANDTTYDGKPLANVLADASAELNTALEALKPLPVA